MIHLLNNLLLAKDCELLVSEFRKQEKTRLNADIRR
jgi:hypothetical protein